MDWIIPNPLDAFPDASYDQNIWIGNIPNLYTLFQTRPMIETDGLESSQPLDTFPDVSYDRTNGLESFQIL